MCLRRNRVGWSLLLAWDFRRLCVIDWGFVVNGETYGELRCEVVAIILNDIRFLCYWWVHNIPWNGRCAWFSCMSLWCLWWLLEEVTGVPSGWSELALHWARSPKRVDQGPGCKFWPSWGIYRVLRGVFSKNLVRAFCGVFQDTVVGARVRYPDIAA
jgi:hypothetical protein